ncbi:titin [Drosophila santomea]|uniref:titin n=1 Tax=Drosophila santomea TaxID=129105 RepID=UPI001954BD75|nr:titin [Drosophila santomea]
MASISKSRVSSCSSRKRLHLQLGSPLCVIVFCLLASCSAQPIESTSLPAEVDDVQVTTILPIQLEASSPKPETTIKNETAPTLPVEEPKVAESNPIDHIEATDNFVSVYGGNLEQDIKNDVNSEVEDAPSPVEPIIEDVQKAAEAALENHEIEFAVQSAREPKTLDAEEDSKPIEEDRLEHQEEPETVTDNIAVSSEQLESHIKPLPSVTSDLVSVILNEDKAITEQPITKTNLLALEQEHDKFEGDESTTVPVYEEPKHQVTKKQGVEDPSPVEIAPEVSEEHQLTPSEEPQTLRNERKFEEHDDNLNEINENTIEGEEAPSKTSTTVAPLVHVEPTKSRTESNEEIEKKAEAEAKAEMEEQVEVNTPSVEATVEAADPDDAQHEVNFAETTEEAITEAAKIVEEQETKEDASVEQGHLKEHTVQVASEANREANPTEESINEEIFSKGDDESMVERDGSESEEKPTENAVVDEDFSEEQNEPVVDETKTSSDDSTATPLVSYPPHDAGQTFDSNSADEHSAQLSGATNYRSTMIIVLCSGTAVIFIVTSLVIFVVSFQRQHGTLDIEMQEQRLGKDVQDEDNVQMKLLDVDLSSPVILPMGNEETDECL